VKLAALAVVVLLAGCTSGSTGSAASGECNCPSGYDGGACVCGNSTVPVCPVQKTRPPTTCTVDGGQCMGCDEGAGFFCTCLAGLADGGGLRFLCDGTERACTGGPY
jgi:hypothetical protein